MEPGGVYLAGTFDKVAVGVDTQTLVEEHLAIAALAATDKKDEVVACGKAGDVGHAVGY